MIENHYSSSINSKSRKSISKFEPPTNRLDKETSDFATYENLLRFVESIKKGKPPSLDLSTLQNVMAQPVYGLNDRSPNLSIEHTNLLTDISTIKANLARIEKDIKDAFHARKKQANESLKFLHSDNPVPSLSKINNSSSYNKGVVSETMNKQSDGYDELLQKAKLSLKHQQEIAEVKAKNKDFIAQSQAKSMEEKIQATRQQFYQSSALLEAGPKYTNHFLSFNGDILHIEIVRTTVIFVITSKGYLELWTSPDGISWTLSACQVLSSRLPKLTCVKCMTPSSMEQNHLVTNRLHYLNTSESSTSYTNASNDDPMLFQEPSNQESSDTDEMKQFTSSTYKLDGETSYSLDAEERSKQLIPYHTHLIHWLSEPSEMKKYLIGCINGEIYMYDIGVIDDQQTQVKFLHKAQASLTSIKFVTYFAPGHRVIVHVHQQDEKGQLMQGLSIFCVHTLTLLRYHPFTTLFDTLPSDMATLEDGTDLSSIPLTALSADNIRARVYLGLRFALLEFGYLELPPSNESTYSNTKSMFESNLDSLEKIDPQEEDEEDEDQVSPTLELILLNSLSIQLRSKSISLSNSYNSSAIKSEQGFIFNMPPPVFEEKTDIVSITPYTSPLTFQSYLIVSCMDASIQCFGSQPVFGSEVFYYSSEFQFKNHPVQMNTFAIAFSRELQVVCCISTLGHLSLLAMDRKVLISEHQLLTHRLAGSKFGLRELFPGEIGTYKLAIASGKEWSLMDLKELVTWIDVHLNSNREEDEKF